MAKIFIDGSAGTTGLRIYDRLLDRKDLEIIVLPEELRKDESARRDALHNADIAFLCLPDVAAIESVSLAKGSKTKIIDTSTAHRTNDDWVYGFPELTGMKEKIKNSTRIANPGCYASGFISLVVPLVENGILSKDSFVNSFAVSGYSGAGNKGIAEYEDENRAEIYNAPRQYALTQEHKHLPEMAKISGLSHLPIFCPLIAPYYSGMEVTVSLFKKDINGTMKDVKEVLESYYRNSQIVKYDGDYSENGFLSACSMSGRDDMEISVHGNEDRILLVSRFDNLGKGASGAAIQNMNILLGVPETTGLVIK